MSTTHTILVDRAGATREDVLADMGEVTASCRAGRNPLQEFAEHRGFSLAVLLDNAPEGVPHAVFEKLKATGKYKLGLLDDEYEILERFDPARSAA